MLVHLICGLLPYVAVLFLVIGLAYKVAYWARAPLHLNWELFPYPSTRASQLGELVLEVLELKSLFHYNRRIWSPSLVMHWGIYIVFIWLILLPTGLPGVSYLGPAGAVAALVGSLLLLVVRLAYGELRRVSCPVEYVNLLLVFSVSLSGLAGGFFTHAALTRDYLISLVSLNPNPPASPLFLLTIVLLEVFFVYLPFSRMVHFAAKYFSYHKVKWGEVQ